MSPLRSATALQELEQLPLDGEEMLDDWPQRQRREEVQRAEQQDRAEQQHHERAARDGEGARAGRGDLLLSERKDKT